MGDGSVLGVYARLNTWEAVAITLHHVYPVLVVHRHSNGAPECTARSATRREGDGSGHPDHGVLSAKEGARYRGCAGAPTPRPAPAGQGPRSALPHAGKIPPKQTQRGRSNPGRRIFQNASQALIRALPGGILPCTEAAVRAASTGSSSVSRSASANKPRFIAKKWTNRDEF